MLQMPCKFQLHILNNEDCQLKICGQKGNILIPQNDNMGASRTNNFDQFWLNTVKGINVIRPRNTPTDQF